MFVKKNWCPRLVVLVRPSPVLVDCRLNNYTHLAYLPACSFWSKDSPSTIIYINILTKFINSIFTMFYDFTLFLCFSLYNKLYLFFFMWCHIIKKNFGVGIASFYYNAIWFTLQVVGIQTLWKLSIVQQRKNSTKALLQLLR